jgi:hypothetical protein
MDMSNAVQTESVVVVGLDARRTRVSILQVNRMSVPPVSLLSPTGFRSSTDSALSC